MTKIGRSCWVRLCVKWLLTITGIMAAGIAVVVGGMALHGEYQRYVDIEKARYQKETLLSPVVRLVSEYDTPYGRKRLRGSGVIVYSEPSRDGRGYDTYVLTANHVVETPIYSGKRLGKPGDMQHQYYDMTPVGVKRLVTYVEYFDTDTGGTLKVPAYVVAYSPNNAFDIDKDGNMRLREKNWKGERSGEDLALLRLETTEPFHAVKLLPPERIGDIRVLDRVRLVGCALADKPTPTSGEITRVERGFMQVNAPVIFGNSGGACFLEETNEMIGIVNAMRVTNTPTGSQVPVTHMTLVRPISRVYNWLKSKKHAFIYDKTVPDAVRYETIQRDKYARHFILEREREKNIEALKGLIEKLKTDNRDLKERLDKSIPQPSECEPKHDEN